MDVGNHFFSEIEKAYIEDSFNLYGLKQYLPKDYSKALDVILDRLGSKYLRNNKNFSRRRSGNDDIFYNLPLSLAPNEAESEELSRSAALLYGLIHARYIITSVGLETMVHFAIYLL